MEYKFKHSLAVMGQLAQNAGLTPPSEYDPPFEYLDRSVEILARICLKHQESLDQREFIASQIREVERKLNGRLRDVEKEMDGRFNVDERFEKVYEEKDEQFDKMDEHFDTMDDSFESMIARLDNAAAVTKDERLGMMYQQDLKPSGDPKFVWASHPQVPKHMKDAYILGQRAKGIFEPSWDGKSNEQKAQAQQKALHTIKELANFYSITIWSEDDDETEVPLLETTVDDYMEGLLAAWGMDWQYVLKLGMEHMQAQSQQAGVKRAGEASSTEERKKARGGREEEAD